MWSHDTHMICPQGTKQDIMYGGVRLVPGVVILVIFCHEMDQSSGEDFNPLATEFDV